MQLANMLHTQPFGTPCFPASGAAALLEAAGLFFAAATTWSAAAGLAITFGTATTAPPACPSAGRVALMSCEMRPAL